MFETEMQRNKKLKSIRINPNFRKIYTAKKPKGKVLDYKAVQERKDMVENRLVRKIF